MPAENLHLAQAQKNERFYSTFDLSTTEFLDWAVITLFYSSLHYIDAYLAKAQNYHPLTHSKRTPLVAREFRLKVIYSDYRKLKDESEAARYQIKKFKLEEVGNLEKGQFERIKHHLLKLLR
jgi:hypothetical protein